MRWLFVFIGAWLLCAGSTQAAVPVVSDVRGSAYVLENHMDFLRDAGAALTPAQAMARTDWQALHGQPSFGFTDDTIWLRFVLEQPSHASTSWRLEVRNALIEDVRLYAASPDGQWTEQHSGRRWRHSDWPIRTRSPALAIELSPGSHVFLLRLSARNALSSPVLLWPADEFLEHTARESLLWGIYFGIYGMAILVQLLFWQWTRESLSGWYVLCASFNCLGLLVTAGYPQNVLDLQGDTALYALGLVITPALFFVAKFSVVLLDLAQPMPRLNRWLLWSTGLCSSLTTGLVLAGHYGTAMVLYQNVSIVLILVLLAACLYLYWRGYAPARVFLWVFSFFYLGIAIRFLRNLGWLEPSLLNDNSIQIGSLLHMVAMCVFIVQHYNALRISLQVEQETRQRQREFVAMVSHEYRTPLAIINTSAQLLAAQLDGPRDKSLQRCHNIRDATRRMSDLLDTYLSTERLEEAHQPLRPVSCNPHVLIESIAAHWPTQRLRVELHDLPSTMVCDAGLLQVALHNLLVNADRHAPTDDTIWLQADSHAHGELHIAVGNSGEPIPTDELPLLFQKYFRGRATRQKPGAGLGLFLVKRVADLHGGQVSVRSDAVETVFDIRLPLMPR